MLWTGTAVTLVATVLAPPAVILVERSADVDELGSVSRQWIAQHRSQ